MAAGGGAAGAQAEGCPAAPLGTQQPLSPRRRHRSRPQPPPSCCPRGLVCTAAAAVIEWLRVSQPRAFADELRPPRLNHRPRGGAQQATSAGAAFSRRRQEGALRGGAPARLRGRLLAYPRFDGEQHRFLALGRRPRGEGVCHHRVPALPCCGWCWWLGRAEGGLGRGGGARCVRAAATALSYAAPPLSLPPPVNRLPTASPHACEEERCGLTPTCARLCAAAAGRRDASGGAARGRAAWWRATRWRRRQRRRNGTPPGSRCG
jgi:hypothetical protein